MRITEALGEFTQVYFDSDEQDRSIIAKLPGIHRGVRNTVLRMTADPENVHLFSNGNSLRS